MGLALINQEASRYESSENKFELTLFDSKKRLVKTYFDPTKKPKSTGFASGSATKQILDFCGFATLLESLESSQALTFGVPSNGQEHNQITYAKDWRGLKNGKITRSRKHFCWPAGAGIWYLDIDGSFTDDELNGAIAKLYAYMPEIEKAPHIVTRSSSHGLVVNGVQKNGGAHIYVLVDEARKIPELTETLYFRLFEEFGYFSPSNPNKKTGICSLLNRNLIDKSVSQPERIDYAAAPVIECVGISRQPVKPMVRNPDSAPLKTSEIAPLSEFESSRYEAQVKERRAECTVKQSNLVSGLPLHKVGSKKDKKQAKPKKAQPYMHLDENLGTIEAFKETLPVKPYHADDLRFGLHINTAERALAAKNIQPNGPTHLRWLVFDVDRSTAATDWKGLGCPTPNFTVTNPKNGHAHLFYGLKTPVRKAEGASLKALQYVASIEEALREKLNADLSYSGLMAKNPLHPYWITETHRDQLYELKELHHYFDLLPELKKRKQRVDLSEGYALSRNCRLFDALRQWAYVEFLRTWPSKEEEWHDQVKRKAEQLNTFASPLPEAEAVAIATSIARFTLKEFSKEKLSEIQARRGALGGTAKGKANEFKRQTALRLIDEGKTQKVIAEQLDISTRTVRRWIQTRDIEMEGCRIDETSQDRHLVS